MDYEMLSAVPPKQNEETKWKDLLDGKMTLITLEFVSSGNNINDEKVPYAIFCHIENWSHHHNAPHQVPMFRYLQIESKYCKSSMLRVKLDTAMKAVRAYDETPTLSANIKFLEFKGAIFHESRVGSTLIANMLASLPENRVYSESSPPVLALNHVCHPQRQQQQQNECTHDVLMNVLYLMRRVSATDPEQYLFWKFQSAATWQLERFVNILPDIPWIFVYRDPIQVMVSHFQDEQKYYNKGRGVTPKCAQRQKHQPQPRVVTMLERHFSHLGHGRLRLARAVSMEQYCAAHLASLTQSAVEVLQKVDSRGRAINYESLPNILWEQLLPNHFDYNISARQITRMQQQAREYSKSAAGKASKVDEIGTFQSDSQEKEQAASLEIKAAVKRVLQESYVQLEAFSKQSIG